MRVYQFRHIRAERQSSRRQSAPVVAEGSPTPDFEPTSGEGEAVRLSDRRGKPIVLHFSPRDDAQGS